METLLLNLQTSDVKEKVVAVEKLLEKAKSKNSLNDVQNELRVKLISAGVAIINDANPKVSTTALDFLSIALTRCRDCMQPLLNIVFDALIAKFSDNKASVRLIATETMATVAGMMGVPVGIDRLVMQLEHKNYRVREGSLQAIKGTAQVVDISSMCGILGKLVGLLSDKQPSVRQLAVETIGSLYSTFGDTLMSTLRSSDLKAQQLKLIKDYIAINKGDNNPKGVLKLSCARTNCPLGDFNSTGNRKVSTTTRDGVENNDQSIPTNTVLNGSSEPITKERSSSSQRSRSAVHGRRSPSISVSSVDSNSNLSKTRAATPESFETTRPSSSMQVVSYSPDCFYNLIEENSNVKTVKSPCESLTEREILRCLSDAHHSFSKLEDWQARIRSLGVIQAIILTSKNSQFPKNLFSVICNQLKVMQESLCTQIGDLRSVIVKEACRTVAIASHVMKSQFAAVAEFLWPYIVKQVAVKISVISSSANRCLKIIIVSNSDTRLLQAVCEGGLNKNPGIRMSSLECLCLAAALWTNEALTRCLSNLRAVLKSGLTDADARARKISRTLFWILHSRQPCKRDMEVILNESEQSLQRYLNSEIQIKSSELQELLDIVESSSVYRSDCEEAFDNAMRGELSLLQTGSGVASEICRSRTATPSLDTANASNESCDAEWNIFDSHDMIHGSTRRSSDVATKSSLSGAKRVVVGRPSTVSVQPRRAETLDVRPATVASNRESQKNLEHTESSIKSAEAWTESSVEDFLSFEEKNSVSSRNLSISSAVSRRNSLQGGAKRIMNAHSSRTISNELNDRQVTAACTTSINTSLSSLNTLDELKNGAKEKSFSDGSLPNKSNQSISAVNDTVASDGSLFESSSEKYTGVSMEVFVFSADYLTKLSLDALWSNRKRAFEEIKRRIERAVTEKEVMHSSLFDVFIRLSLEHLSDSHIKVSLEAIDVIDECVKNCASQCRSHLAAIIVALFQKLGDKRGSIKDKANNILNLIRVSFEPTEIMSGLAPRLVDISEKFRTALMQFLGAIAPYCASYFQVAQNSWAFLGRLATILDSSTGKHVSITLLSAGRRLLELVYKASPDIICSQIFMLSFQQQIIIKKLLEILEPEINIKVAEAGKSAWNRPISEKNDAHASNKSDLDMRSIEEHVTSSDFQSEKNLKDSAARIKDDKRASLTDDISNNNGYLPYAPNKSPPSFQSPYRTVTCIASQKDLGLEVLAHSKINQIEQSQKCFPVNCAVDKTSTSWLLSALKISAKRCDRLEALEYVKRTAKTADEKYWQDNCSQVVCVLLEAFEGCSQITSPVSELATESQFFHQPTAKSQLTGFSPIGVQQKELEANSPKTISNTELNHDLIEHMHLCCKALLVISKYIGKQMKNLLDLVVTKLCNYSEKVPLSISIHFEQILTNLSTYEPRKLVHLLVPYTYAVNTSGDNAAQTYNGCPTEMSPEEKTAWLAQFPHVRLIAMHVIASTIRFMSSSEILDEVNSLATAILPSLASPLVDIRKAVIVILVEVYTTIGDALYPYITELSVPQRKLLTIYIERKISKKDGVK